MYLSHMERSHRNRAGFTIIELATVIGIFFLLIAILAPFVNMVKSRARRIGCEARLMKLSLALHRYAQDHGRRFPARLGDLYPAYVGNEEAFDCPATRTMGTAKDPEYDYVTESVSISTPHAIIIKDRTGNHGPSGKNTVRVNGAVEWDTK